MPSMQPWKGRNVTNRRQTRQQVVPFFDYDPDVFYPLLDDARFIGIFENLMGEDFILVATEGIIHTGGSPWHHDACAPEEDPTCFFDGIHLAPAQTAS